MTLLDQLKYSKRIHFSFLLTLLFSSHLAGQGYWTALDYAAPDPNGGVMILLSDGTVMCKSSSGSDAYGDVWNILTPDYDGTYQGATWTTATPMHKTRLYFSSKILKDGRLYVAGGEYGTGASNAEVYNPLTNTWTMTAAPPLGTYFYDANSQMLPNGKVLQGVVYSTTPGYKGVYIYNPAHEICLVQFESNEHTEYIFSMTDNTGRVIKTSKGMATNGKNQLPVTLNGLAAGLYNLSIQTASGSKTFKLVVQ